MAARNLLAFILFAGGCTAAQSLTSRAPAEEVIVDAKVAEWEGALSPVDGSEFSLGVLNDQDNLYIALVSHNQQVIRQIVTRGLTFWIDPTGGKEKVIGLRYPTGMSGQDRPAASVNAAAGAERMRGAIERAASYFEIVQGDEVWRPPVNSLPNVSASAAMEYGTLTIEVLIPLNSSTHFDLGTPVGSTIGLGLETSPLDFDELRQGSDGPGSAVGRGGRGGAVPGFGGRAAGLGDGSSGRTRSPGQGIAVSEQLKLWTIVTLAR